MVGSSNLTSGLVANVEAATLLRGTAGEHPIAAFWTWGESLWADPRVLEWAGTATERDEEIEPELLAALAAVASASPVVYTLGGSPRPNRIRDVTPTGIWAADRAGVPRTPLNRRVLATSHARDQGIGISGGAPPLA